MNCYASQLRKSIKILNRAYDRALEPTALSFGQLIIMDEINKNSNLADYGFTILAKNIGLDRTTCVRVISPLIKKGLIFISEPGRDKRCKRPALTNIGKIRLAEALPLWEKIKLLFYKSYKNLNKEIDFDSIESLLTSVSKEITNKAVSNILK